MTPYVRGWKTQARLYAGGACRWLSKTAPIRRISNPDGEYAVTTTILRFELIGMRDGYGTGTRKYKSTTVRIGFRLVILNNDDQCVVTISVRKNRKGQEAGRPGQDHH